MDESLNTLESVSSLLLSKVELTEEKPTLKQAPQPLDEVPSISSLGNMSGALVNKTNHTSFCSTLALRDIFLQHPVINTSFQ